MPTKTRATTDLERFLRAELGRRGEDRVTRLDVRHSHSSGSDRVWSGAVSEYEPKDFDQAIDLLVESLGEKMQADADSKGGTQNYVVICCAGREIVSQQRFRIRGQDLDNGFADHASEAPDAKGMNAFAMRHIDGAYRLAVGANAETIKDLRDQVAELRTENKALKDEVGKAFKLQLEWQQKVQELMNQDAQREMAKQRADRRDQRRDKILGTATKIMPRLLAHVPGGEQIAELASMQDGFEGILKSIARDPAKAEMFTTMMGASDLLTDTQKAWLTRTINDQTEREIEAEKKRRANRPKAVVG